MHASAKWLKVALPMAGSALLCACSAIDTRPPAQSASASAQAEPAARGRREASTGSRLPGGSSANSVRTLGSDDAQASMRNAPPNPGGKVY